MHGRNSHAGEPEVPMKGLLYWNYSLCEDFEEGGRLVEPAAGTAQLSLLLGGQQIADVSLGFDL